MIRFGLIGYGLFGSHHAQAITRTEGAELVAIAVKSAESQGKAQAAHPEAAIYGDYQQLLTRSDIDAVNVVVPNSLHHRIGRDVLAANKHMLLEKPMATTLGDCDDLIRAAKAKQLKLAIGHELRLSSLWGQAKSLIDQGRIGVPKHALIELSRFPYRQGSEGWRYDIDRVGSWVLEEPIHFFDLARWYLAACGEPVSVYARATQLNAGQPELKDNFSAVINHAGGEYAIVSQTLAAFGHHQAAKVCGSEGTIWMRWGAADARSDRPQFDLRYGYQDQVEQIEFTKPTGELLELADQIGAFTASIENDSDPPCTGEDGRWSTLLCLAAEASIAEQRIIDLREFAGVHQ